MKNTEPNIRILLELLVLAVAVVILAALWLFGGPLLALVGTPQAQGFWDWIT